MTVFSTCSISYPKLKDHFPRVFKGNNIFPKCLSQILRNIKTTCFNKMSKNSFEENMSAYFPFFNYSPV